MLLYHEIGGGPPRLEAAESVALLHAAGVLFEDLANRRAHRKLPVAGIPDPSACSVELGPAFVGAAELSEPVRTVEHDMRHAAGGLDILYKRGFAPEAAGLQVGGAG